jgi:uncharacterized OB-fold protein
VFYFSNLVHSKKREVRAMSELDDVLTSTHVLEYPYLRSVGPVLGAFFTALRDGVILGATAHDGSVIVPPAEYDNETGEATGALVPVGPDGTVTAWAWVTDPMPSHPLDHAFAWVLVQLRGADTSLLHVLDGVEQSDVRTGMDVVADFLPEGRVGAITDIRAFVPKDNG